MATRPILITGAAGFIGSRFVRSCNAKGIPTVSVDRASHFQTRAEHRSIDFGEKVDRDELFAWLEKSKTSFQAIVHLGACSRTTETDVEYLRKNNVEYSQKLWAMAAQRKTPFVYASSAATYGDGALGYLDEEKRTESLRPLNAYGESKRLFDLWAIEQDQLGNRPPAWSGFRFFNVYGPGEMHKQAMASVVLHAYQQILKSGRVRLFKSHRPDFLDGEQKRDFIHVDDVVDVLHFAVQKPMARGIFNLGTGEARSFLDLVRAVFQSLGKRRRSTLSILPSKSATSTSISPKPRCRSSAMPGTTPPLPLLRPA